MPRKLRLIQLMLRKQNVLASRQTAQLPRPGPLKMFYRGTSTLNNRLVDQKPEERYRLDKKQPLKLDSLYNQRNTMFKERSNDFIDLFADKHDRDSLLKRDQDRPVVLDRIDKGRHESERQQELVRKQSAKNTRIGGLVGLSNIGNTCFMNSTLQCLFNLPDFNQYFISGKYRGELKGNGRVADSYGKLVALIRTTTSKYETPSVLKSALASRHSQFAGYAQQDAQEFLSNLLECIGEDLSRVNKKSVPYKELTADTKKHTLKEISNEWWKYYRDREDSIVFDFFSGQLISKVTCSKCHNQSIAFDIFNDLQLSFAKGETDLSKLIEQFLKQEPLSDDYFCSNCKQLRQSKIKLGFFRMPKILVFQLKRFTYGKWRKDKINSRIGFPDELDLTKFMTETKQTASPRPIYQLSGVVNHSGGIDFGHYTADCRNPFNHKWYTFNDSHVSPSSYSDQPYHESSAPYLLFYSRKNI